MTFYIRCDMEGVTGVISFDQAVKGNKEYESARHMLMSDILSVIDGLNESGSHQIVIYDMHGSDGKNLDIDKMPDNVKVYEGKPPYTDTFHQGIDSTFDGLILVGFHSMAGTPNGLLAHSYELETEKILVNNIPVGEIGIEVGIAGEFNVPLVLITGDSLGIEEARELVPQTECVVVKDSISSTSGHCREQIETAREIREKALSIGKKLPSSKPLIFSPPIDLKITLQSSEMCDKMKKMYPEYFVNKHTLEINGKSLLSAWMKYDNMKRSLR